MVDVTIDEDTFGNTTDPISGENQIVKRFTFTNQNGLSVQVITYGATITSIRCPDKFGNIDDVVLGFDDVDGKWMVISYWFKTSEKLDFFFGLVLTGKKDIAQ